ncbi:class D beta-lactamase [Flocculibacter collagenilyticus]|uniref:class D beta-lactamase n=1 Tax=Flocculibacter collagenilyticus TaxID=2744479 RepID=UPI0018F44311|nr:class D beta-lactamase [Flocculibacter collagenilyticus]
MAVAKPDPHSIQKEPYSNQKQLGNVCEEGNAQCTFVLLKESEPNTVVIHNLTRAMQQFSPFSTFKIASSLIALDTKAVTDIESQILLRDEQRFPTQQWWRASWTEQQHNLKSAFQHSALPLFQTLTVKIGKPTFAKYVRQFNYGNSDVSGPVDSFWLNNSLKISALEQVNFLRNIRLQKLGVAESTYQHFKQVMRVNESRHPAEKQLINDYHLYAKTGTGRIDKNTVIGWYVGYLETTDKQDTYYFAFNITAPTYQGLLKKRKGLAITLLNRHLN